MKLTAALLLLCFLHVSAAGLAQTVSIERKEAKLSEILTEIHKQTGYNILFNDKIIAAVPSISMSAKNMKLTDLLDKLLIPNKLKYSMMKHNIFIVPAEARNTEALLEKKQQSVSGMVTDSLGNALRGVSVVKKGSAQQAITDVQGRFQIAAGTGDVLIFSFIGYRKHEIIVGNDISLQIVLQPEISGLDEVVVTALGIKREEKALGYAQQTIKAEELATAASANWSEGLKGKVAGLNIVSGSTGPINSQSIQLRGTTSLDPGGNYALIVIDGVPMNQETTAYGNNVGAAYGTEAPVDYGNAVSELKQEDIESVTVLKGPSAAALYGSRAANGALIITTKSGQKNQRIGIGFNSTILADRIINWPDYQYEYGGGSISRVNEAGEQYYSWGDSEDGPNTNTPVAFGPKFNGQYYYQYDAITQEQGAERTLWRPYTNNKKDFFRTGLTFENSLSLQGGDSNGSMRLSLSRTDNKYIAPNTGYERNTVSFNGNYQISKAIKLSSVLNYNNRASDNLPGFGMSNGSLGYFMMFLLPNVDINWYKPIWQKGNENLVQLNPFSDWSSNPYFLMYEDTNPLKSNQVIGNVKADIKISNHLDFMARVSLNTLSQLRETQRGYSSKKHPRGYYGRQDVSSQEVNADFLLTYKNTFAEQFNYSVMVGGNRMSYDHQNVMSEVDALIVPKVYTLANGVNNPLVRTNDARKQINSFYGMLSLSWNDRIFLDATGRNDWSSTLPSGNNSYFYPSVTSSFILSELFDLPAPISLFKYRLSYAKVGSDANPYETSKYYSQSGFPSSAIVPGVMYNANLKPEITSSWETGVDYRMFNNRLGLDLTFYASSTKNQILSLPNDIVSGYSSRVINAGEVRNKGVEIVATGTPIKSSDFEWDVTVNWSHNHNEIIELNDNLERQTLAQVWQGHLIGTVGGSTTDLWGTKFVRDDQGNMVFNNGVPTWSSSPEYIGNTAPNWRAGLTNTFRYKNFRFSATIDGSYGGLIYSGTYNRASWDGFLANTLPGREEGEILGKGVMRAENGSFVENTIPVNTQTYYTQYHQVTEAGVFESSFIKLREVSLTYTFPKTMFKKIPIADASLSIFGRNIAVFDKFPMWDPEGGTMNGTVFVPGLEMAPMPYTATYGATLKVGF
jgi:TonB-linked SusC/RagA family outer membrane protein